MTQLRKVSLDSDVNGLVRLAIEIGRRAANLDALYVLEKYLNESRACIRNCRIESIEFSE